MLTAFFKIFETLSESICVSTMIAFSAFPLGSRKSTSLNANPLDSDLADESAALHKPEIKGEFPGLQGFQMKSK